MIEVNDLSIHIQTEENIVHAVNHVSLNIQKGETVSIVGESGSGKSVLANALMRLNDENYFTYPNGSIYLNQRDILTMSRQGLRQLRGQEIAMIFQDPMSSLNPVLTVGKQITEAIRTHQKMSKKAAQLKALELLEDVGMPDSHRRMHEYPHQFSGGMRQRILIAMALASKPKLLIADEPTTALDVTIQAQIMQLLKDIQVKYGTAILMITHDLGLVSQIADRIYVMYAGEIVETGSPEDIFYHTRMPYTWSLLKSIPQLKTRERLFAMAGQPPSLTAQTEGCPFYERCLFRKTACQTTKPLLKMVETNHQVACILSHEEFSQQAKIINEGLKKEKI